MTNSRFNIILEKNIFSSFSSSFFFFGLYRSGYKTSNDANTPVLSYSCILTFLSPSERFRVLLFLTCLKKINSQNDFKLRLEETACRFQGLGFFLIYKNVFYYKTAGRSISYCMFILCLQNKCLFKFPLKFDL